jgi:hypothetical protein
VNFLKTKLKKSGVDEKIGIVSRKRTPRLSKKLIANKSAHWKVSLLLFALSYEFLIADII